MSPAARNNPLITNIDPVLLPLYDAVVRGKRKPFFKNNILQQGTPGFLFLLLPLPLLPALTLGYVYSWWWLALIPALYFFFFSGMRPMVGRRPDFDFDRGLVRYGTHFLSFADVTHKTFRIDFKGDKATVLLLHPILGPMPVITYAGDEAQKQAKTFLNLLLRQVRAGPLNKADETVNNSK